MKLKKVWMLSVFVFLFHMKNSMINIFLFLGLFCILFWWKEHDNGSSIFPFLFLLA